MTNKIKQWRIKPNFVEAISLEVEEDFEVAANWCGGRVEKSQPGTVTAIDIYLQIPTLDPEPLLARRGDTVMKGKDGGFGIMKTEVFLDIYQLNVWTPRSGKDND